MGRAPVRADADHGPCCIALWTMTDGSAQLARGPVVSPYGPKGSATVVGPTQKGGNQQGGALATCESVNALSPGWVKKGGNQQGAAAQIVADARREKRRKPTVRRKGTQYPCCACLNRKRS